MEYELVKRKVKDLKADLDQPRKSFKQEDITLLAQTYQSQGIINPIEIDAENVIITGELRWRAAKQAKLNLIDCKLLKKIDNESRFLRQCIENFHHNNLTEKEERLAVEKLHILYPNLSHVELGKKLGRSQHYISEIIKLPQIEKELGSKTLEILGKRSTVAIAESSKNIVEKRKIAKKAIEEKMTQPKVLELIKNVKELPKEVKDEVLKPKSEITLEQAKEVAEFPELEQRKAVMKQLKQTKQAERKIIDQNKQISKGKAKPPVTVENLDMKFLRIWENIEKDIKIKMRKDFLRPYSEKTKQEAITIAERIVEFLIREFREDFKKFKEVKLIGAN